MVLACVFRQFAVIRANNDRVLVLAVALQSQQTADMMHDALRGDTIAAMLAARTQNAAQLAEVQKDFTEHALTFRTQMEENARRDLGPTAAAKLRGISGPLENYFKVTADSIALTLKDENAAEAGFITVQTSFHEMEDAMAALSEAIEAEAKKQKLVGADLAAYRREHAGPDHQRRLRGLQRHGRHRLRRGLRGPRRPLLRGGPQHSPALRRRDPAPGRGRRG